MRQLGVIGPDFSSVNASQTQEISGVTASCGCLKNRALSLLYPYGALTSCKKLEQINEWSLRYLKTDKHTHKRTHGQGRLLRTPSGKPGVQNKNDHAEFKCEEGCLKGGNKV